MKKSCLSFWDEYKVQIFREGHKNKNESPYLVKFVFSKKTTKIDEIFTVYVVTVKLTVKILSNFVAFLENTDLTH